MVVLGGLGWRRGGLGVETPGKQLDQHRGRYAEGDCHDDDHEIDHGVKLRHRMKHFVQQVGVCGYHGYPPDP